MKIPRILPLAACVAGTLSVCWSQTSASFKSVTSTSGVTPANIYAVDVNGDGYTDIIQDSEPNSPAGFTVSINKDNGTFLPPEAYKLPGKAGPMCIAAHDFNNDGSVDLAVPVSGTNQIALYLNYGNGNFKSPIISTVNLPSGYTFGQLGCAAGDFNGDGNEDLALWTANAGWDGPNGLTKLYVIQGDGNGSFNAAPHLVLNSGPAQPEMQVFAGDYDRDGNVDIATEIQVEDFSSGNPASTALHVLYGNNNFTFDDTTPYTYNGLMTIGSGDLNSDGYTDLFALVGGVTDATQLGVFYGEASRTFKAYWTNLSNSYRVGAGPDGWWWQPQLAMADYNGDGRMDLAAYTVNEDYSHAGIDFFLAGSNPGEFTSQVVDLPAEYTTQSTPVAGLFSGSFLNPDLAINESNNYGDPPQNTPSYLTAMLNQDHNWFGPCIYPRAGQGINVCEAGNTYQSKQTFGAAVNSFGELRTMTLWVDGKKAAEQYHTWGQHGYFNWTGTFSAGKHSAVMVAGDVDHREQKYNFTFTVQ